MKLNDHRPSLKKVQMPVFIIKLCKINNFNRLFMDIYTNFHGHDFIFMFSD